MLQAITVDSACLTELWWYDDHTATPILGDENNSACWPVSAGVTVSPATCPPGYHAATDPTTIPGQTVDLCCPSGYHVDGGYLSCTSAASTSLTAMGTSTDTDGIKFTQLITYKGVNANSIAVRYAASDLQNTGSSSSSATSTAATNAGSTLVATTPTPAPSATLTNILSSTTISSQTPAPTPESTTAPQGDGLSTGAKAGIGVGVGIVAIALLVLLISCLAKRWTIRRKEPSAHQGMNSADSTARMADPSSFLQEPHSGEKWPHDRQPYHQQEMSAMEDAVNLASPMWPRELGDTRAPSLHELHSDDAVPRYSEQKSRLRLQHLGDHRV